MFVTRCGIHIPFKDTISSKLQQSLTVTPTTQEFNTQPIRAYKEQLNKELVVPYHWGKSTLDHDHDITDTRPLGEDLSSLQFQGSLRPDLQQPQAVAACVESLRKTGGAVLSLATGQGKTCCGLHIACTLRGKTLILVHKNFLADQWQERIRQFVPTASVSRIQGSVCDTSGDFVIAMVQTLVSRQYPPTTFAPFRTLIFDEAHHVAARVFCTVMFSLNMPFTLGLTATPTRTDGLERLIHWFLGPMAYNYRQLQKQRGTVATVHALRYRCDAYSYPPPVNRLGNMDYTQLVTQVAENQHRTVAIARYVARHARDADVLVLTHRRAHCEHLTQALKECGLDAASYMGGAKKVPGNKILVSTYAFVSEGFDEPRLSVLVLATPASSVTQAVGRVLRGKALDAATTSKVYDIVDEWSVCFALARKRAVTYKELGLVVKPPSPLLMPLKQPCTFLPDN